MSQVRLRHILFFLTIQTFLTIPAFPQGYDDAFELRSKLKLELQYADYGEYEYPEPVLYRYGVTEYRQIEPFIANFPEKRFLLKYTRMTDDATAYGVRYQYSDLKEDAKQHFIEAKLTRALGKSSIYVLATQLLYDTRGYTAFQAGAGALWDVSALTSVQCDLQYFYRGPEATAVGGRMGTLSFRTKARQVLTMSTAVQGEYTYYSANGDAARFSSHTLALWLSQYLPTETALHLNARYYTNSAGIQSFAPSLEVAQYIDWATVLWVKYRYYRNQSDNVSLGEQSVIIPDGLRSSSVSAQVNRELNPEMLLYVKYRYYTSTLQVQMNTYMVGVVYSF